MDRVETSLVNLSDYQNERGQVRLDFTRAKLLDSSDNPDLATLRYVWKSWRDSSEYIVLQKQTTRADYTVEKETVACKCSKRGNDVYVRRTKRRLAGLQLKGDTDIVFLDWKKPTGNANVLFVTLTYAVQQSSIVEAWTERIAQDWNRWITLMRKRYGKISAARAFESTERGYPHIHAMLVFHDHDFEVHRHFSHKDGKLSATWRVSDQERETLRGNYPAFIDVQAPRTYSAIIRYLSKHILKGTDKTGSVGEFEESGLEADKAIDSFQRAARLGDTTLSLMWVFRKRSFSLSRDLQKKMMAHAQVLADLIPALRNSNRLDDSLEVTWVCLGVFAKWELRIESDRWNVPLQWDELGLESRAKAKREIRKN